MKSRERLEKEREKRSMIYGLIVLGFIFMALCALMILAFSGDNTSVGNLLNSLLYQAKEALGDIWFKISNFLSFLKRGV